MNPYLETIRLVWPRIVLVWALWIVVFMVASCSENPAEVDVTVTGPRAVPDTAFVTDTLTEFVTDTVVRFWWCFAHTNGEQPPHWECDERTSPPPDSFP